MLLLEYVNINDWVWRMRAGVYLFSEGEGTNKGKNKLWSQLILFFLISKESQIRFILNYFVPNIKASKETYPLLVKVNKIN